MRKQRDQQASVADEAEIAVRAACATKLPTLTFEDTARCAGGPPACPPAPWLLGLQQHALPCCMQQPHSQSPRTPCLVPPSFRALLSDLFPGVPVTDATNPQLEAALRAAGADMGLEVTPQQVTKALQLQLAAEQRIGVILVGPSGAGKSTLWQLLEGARAKLGAPLVVHRCVLRAGRGEGQERASRKVSPCHHAAATPPTCLLESGAT
jgi:hypothetical protein